MSQPLTLRASLTILHTRLAEVLTSRDTAALQQTAVKEQWIVFDMIGHINAWGLIFLNEARYMAKHPGKPFPYKIHTTTNYDYENDFLVRRRTGWTAEQHAEENRRLLEEIPAFIDSFAGELPDHPVPLPWEPKPTNIEGVLRVLERHGYEHLDEILKALGMISRRA